MTIVLDLGNGFWIERHSILHPAIVGLDGINFNLDRPGRVRAFFSECFISAMVGRDVTTAINTVSSTEVVLDSEVSALRSFVHVTGAAADVRHYVTVIMSV